MKQIYLFKFSPLAGQIAEDTIIHIKHELPDFADHTDLKQTEQFYQEQAKTLIDALLGSLPQGTLEPLIIELLSHRVSLYRGKWS